MKIKRSLSQVFFRWENPETGEPENRCFEDLPEEEQDEILNSKSPAFAQMLCKQLANTINDLGENFDCYKK